MSFTIYSDDSNGGNGLTWNGSAIITTGSNTTWNGAVTYDTHRHGIITQEQARATLVLNDVPIATRTPRTEVDRLLTEVEEVCALAR